MSSSARGAEGTDVPPTEEKANGATNGGGGASAPSVESPAKSSDSGRVQIKRQAKSPAKSPSRAAYKKPNSGSIKNTILNYFKRSPEKKLGSKPTDKENSSHKVIRQRKHRFSKTNGNRDTLEYRRGYPNRSVKEKPHLKDNLLFYTNEIPSKPRGGYIDDILEDWWGDYKLLETHHGYIQWLFPIREHGMNSLSQELQLHEAEAIKSDPEAQARLIKAYSLMLDFYGMSLKDKETGEIERAENWEARFRNLNENRHNFLRITRIMKSLGELGLEHLKEPFVRFILREALEERTLLPTLDSALDYWLCTIKDDHQREALLEYAYQFIEEV